MRGVLVAVTFAVACAHQPRPPPLDGWRELRSAHFTLRTNLPEDSARTTLDKLETLRWWLQAAWSTGGDSPGITQAVVLGDPTELRSFTDLPGSATVGREGPLLVTAGQTEGLLGDRSPAAEILAHEVAHGLIRVRMPGAPRWFHEGLASYLQRIYAVDDHQVRFGFVGDPQGRQSTHPGRIRAWVGPGAAPRPALGLDDVQSRQWESATPGELSYLYLWAEIWVGLLRTEEPLRMQALEAALAGGMSWHRAWANLRRGLDPVRFQEETWWRRSPSEVRSVAPRPAAAPGAERRLEPWEVHLTLAELWAMAARTQGGEEPVRRMRAEIQAAAAVAPGESSPQVRLAELERDPAVRRERAEALVGRFPGSAAARVFLARALSESGAAVEARQAAVRAAIAAAPDDVGALTSAATEKVLAGDAEGALRTLARAEELEPWNPSVFVTRALVLGATGKCDEAVDSVQRALDVLPDTPSPADVRALVEERERIARACRPSSGARQARE